jgi:predicted nucleic acid-binding protein
MSASPVFLDTSALLALVHADDAHHADVVRVFKALAAAGTPLVTHSYVLVETGALVRRRFGSDVFRRIGEVVRNSATVVWVDERIHAAAWGLAEAGGRNAPGLVDQVSFLVMKDMELVTAVAVDRHFAQQGFRTLP